MNRVPARTILALVTLKYGLAALLTYMAARWLVPKDVLSAVFVALLACRPSLVSAVKAGVDQVLASAVGAASTIVYLLFFPISAWTVGAAIATTYAVASWLRWPYATLVVALFSSLYMTILAQDTLLHTAVLRFQSVLLGVFVGVAVNMVFLPFSYKSNLQVRVQRGLAVVKTQLERVAAAMESEKPAALDATMGAFSGAYRELGELMHDLSELANDFRFQRRPGGLSLVEVSSGDRALRELEWVTHYVQDVVVSTARLQRQAGSAEAGPLVAHAAVIAREAVAVLDRIGEKDFEVATARVQASRQALQPLLMDPGHAMTGDAARLALLLGLAQVLEHLGELAMSCRQLAMVEREGGVPAGAGS